MFQIAQYNMQYDYFQIPVCIIVTLGNLTEIDELWQKKLKHVAFLAIVDFIRKNDYNPKNKQINFYICNLIS